MELHVSLQKNFGAFSLDVDFTVQGERIGVFGPSGSGKSTLVSLLAGLQRPDAGTIRLDGELLYDSQGTVDVPPDQRRIGIVFQRPYLFPHMSVKANLLYGYKRSAPANRRIDFDALVEVLQISHLLSRGVHNLSGGEKQRVAIGRTVLSNPRLLLMDEPLSALDDALRFQIIDYLKATSEAFHIPYLFITHSLLEMRIMSDMVLAVDTGRIEAQTTAEELARSRMGQSPAGYINLLRLGNPRRVDGMSAYTWGGTELLISTASDRPDALFELSSKDIILIKQHPDAISARNLLDCTVADTFQSGNKVGVELASGDDRLVAEIVHEAARELGVKKGNRLFAAIKASAFRRLG
ncbi:molybdenum ABC transporter ATP-binding protein [Geobacter sp. AOG2]|uniref:molybdenum ABC transporter ATP-binding protein n=1 Tax=Geobacter sp. AOG2 TaxID=1566347 RepID=UPI001CC4CF37|nr:molybdenum ABC transporter ATP-binding protein [Geobacter sp. AOG2]GFE61653.1 molybdate-transporting ATPase [Geobacter sp. AOG2]